MKFRTNSVSRIISIGNELRRPVAYEFMPSVLQGMSMTQVCTLQYIAENEEAGVYQKDIERILGIRRSSVSSLLRKMETSGLLLRVSVPEDARLKRLMLTDQSRALVAEIYDVHVRIEEYIRSILTKEEEESLYSILQKLVAGMNNMNDTAEE